MNTEPLFKLYLNSKDKYEIVPTGYSIGAVLFQAIWALWHGVIEKYLLIHLPLVGIAALMGEVSEDFDIVLWVLFVGYYFVIGVVVFPKIANKWRERELVRKGYELVFEARTAKPTDLIEMYASEKRES